MMKSKISSVILILLLLSMTFSCSRTDQNSVKDDNDFIIISGSENKAFEENVIAYGKKIGIKIKFEYAGTLDIMDQLNANEAYDAVWSSNSIWLYMLNDPSMIKNSKFTSVSPVVFAVDRSKAQELGYVDTEVSMTKIVDDIQNKNFDFIMPSVTQTNAGASFYLGMLTTLAGNPEILTSEHLKDENLQSELLATFRGVSRTAGDEDFLQELYLTGNYNAVISYESSITALNIELIKQGRQPLYLIYPTEGVSLSDSPFAYVDRGQEKESAFLNIQSYLLSGEMQKTFEDSGRRTWYGGTNENADKNIFDPAWGIDTAAYMHITKYPSVSVIKEALSLYQKYLRKPIHIVFCLDYSSSMLGSGNAQLIEAMRSILIKENAEKDYIEFSQYDKITILPFQLMPFDVITTNNGEKTKSLIDFIDSEIPYGGTNIYDASIEALKFLDKENSGKYNLSIVLMTDGNSYDGKYTDLEFYYNIIDKDIPIYSIMFGDASDYQLNEIAELTKGKVFDGRINLLDAFKTVRGYN